MSDLLQTIQEQIAKEYFKYHDISWFVLTEDAQLRLWPEVCKRYAFEVAKDALRNASENAKFQYDDKGYPEFYSIENLKKSMEGWGLAINKESITNESNIKL